MSKENKQTHGYRERLVLSEERGFGGPGGKGEGTEEYRLVVTE